MSPAIGLPRMLFYLSLALGAVYFLGMVWWVRPHLKACSASDSKAPLSNHIFLYFVMLFLTLPAIFSTWGIGTFLNGRLDSSPPRTRKVKVTKKVMLSVTPYYLAQDWKNPLGWVYFMAHDQFVKEHPLGSTFTITTKSGWLGYEWYVSGYSIFCGAQNCEPEQGGK